MPFLPDAVPDVSPNGNTLGAWQTLLRRRREWAVKLVNGAQAVAEAVGALNTNIAVIQRGAGIAVENVKQHFANLQPKYHDSKAWADRTCEDQAFLLDNWQYAVRNLGSLRAYEELGQCLPGVHVSVKPTNLGNTPDRQCTLADFLDLNEVKRAADSGQDIHRGFSDRVKDLDATFNRVAIESSRVVEDFSQNMHFSESEPSDLADRLMEEIEVVARKINDDYEHVLALPDTQKSISQAVKMAQLHKNNFLPSLIQINDEINQLIAQAVERKEQVMQSSAQCLQQISYVESAIPTIHSRLSTLDIDDQKGQVFDRLNFAVRLPSLYCSLLVECVRRQEWAEKMTVDSSSLVEEIATYKEEEAKRRKKWVREMDGAIDLGTLGDMALDIEVNVHSQKEKWPKVSRNDVVNFIETLRELGDLDGTLPEIEELLKSLDAPSKEQSRRAKAFKNGSVHEAAFARSLLLRGDDEVIVAMRNEKSRVEEKLKSAESRVRKLEDLLHRQSQASSFSRPTSATGFSSNNGPMFERHATSPVTNFSSALSKARETGPRRPSVSSRRVSMNKDPEEKGLAQRIVGLEAELMNERAQSAELAKRAAAQSNTEDLLKSQIREAISTKEDLLGNLEAQQREFDDERRLLHDENSKVKIQLDQLEDEFDRVLETREHDDKIRLLEQELEQVKSDTASEAESHYRQAESLRVDLSRQQDRMREIESELQQHRQETVGLTKDADQLTVRLQDRDRAQAIHHKALRTTLLHLAQENNIPEEFSVLIETVETVAEKAATHLQDMKDALETLRADNDALEARAKGQDEEIYDLRERLGGEERKVFSLQEDLGSQQTQGASLRSQLDYERDELDQLKTKFAAGETDLNALRTLLTEKENQVADLLGRIGKHEMHEQNLDSQVREQETRLRLFQEEQSHLLAARDAHTSRSGNVSKRLLSQHAMLERLLEQIGLTITQEDGKMVIQKVPKGTSGSTMLGESMKRSASGLVHWKNVQDSAIEFESLRWAESKDPEDIERRFGEFLTKATSFDIDIFSDAVYKRVKDIEHIARKWQREARTYRDKSHRAQGEAHERIALRNFKEGDLALFLPTRDQATKPWAAFNVGAPHCFLREQDSHNLAKRDWLIARISKVEERIVDLSKSINGGLKGSGDQKSGGDKSESGSFPNNENPYELSDGLRWYLIDAAEEKPGAPINVGTGKVTVASANVDAKGSIRMKKAADGNGATKTLTRSLDSRRSSTNSRKGLVAVTSNSPASNSAGFDGMVEQSIDNAAAAAAASSNLQETKDTHQAQGGDRPRSSETLDVPVSSGPAVEHVGNSETSLDP